jgi:prepilin-type N-terminal cleavage/methylation domain-containing protein
MLKKDSGFTLIEILIVVALLAILAVAALAALNPVAAQRKTRDAQRLKEMASMQAIIEQFVTDNPTASLSVSSIGGTNTCSGGWMSSDMCNYTNTLPIDPANKASNYVKTDNTMTAGSLTYFVTATNGNYRICTRLESQANSAKLTSDGTAGNASATAYEVYNNSTSPSCGI